MHVKSGIRSHSKYEFIKHKTCTHTPSLRSLFFLFLFPLPLAFYLNLGENSILRIISHDRPSTREKLPSPVEDTWRRDGKIAMRISRRRPGRCGTRKKRVGIQSKQGLPGRRAAIVTKAFTCSRGRRHHY